MSSSFHHHLGSPGASSTKDPHMSRHKALPTTVESSLSTSVEQLSDAQGKVMVELPSRFAISNPASTSQLGTNEQGLEQRNSLSRLTDSLSSIQVRRSGPAVLRTGTASMILISSRPPGASSV
jgi:hypothetical protein